MQGGGNPVGGDRMLDGQVLLPLSPFVLALAFLLYTAHLHGYLLLYSSNPSFSFLHGFALRQGGDMISWSTTIVSNPTSHNPYTQPIHQNTCLQRTSPATTPFIASTTTPSTSPPSSNTHPPQRNRHRRKQTTHQPPPAHQPPPPLLAP